MFYVNAFSIICALGNSNEEVAHNLAANHSPGMVTSTDWLVSDEEAVFFKVADPLPSLPERLSQYEGRCNRIVLKCFESRQEEFKAALDQVAPDRIGIVIGTSTSGSAEADDYICHGDSDQSHFDSRRIEMADPALFLADYLNVTGPVHSISTACTSSTNAFISAVRLLQSGQADAVIVGGVDCLARMTVGGFDALKSLSRDRCRPFSAERQGISIGEGAALFVLSGKPSKIRLAGWGSTSDAHHMTAPEPSGRGAADAMTEALKRAQLRFADLGYVNLHGTGTELNDAAESLAIASFDGFNEVLCSSTKNLTGHTLGAAGAVESALCCLLLQEEQLTVPVQFAPPDAVDPKLPALRFPTAPTKIVKDAVMTNNLAFAGSNASLIFTRERLFDAPSAYVPHRPPMLLVTRVLDISSTSVDCALDLSKEGPLGIFADDQGRVPEACLLELMAQTVGVWGGYRRNQLAAEQRMPTNEAQAPAEVGLLLSARNFTAETVTLGSGELICHMNKLMDDNKIACFEGEVRKGQQVVAQAKVTVYQPDNQELDRLFQATN